MNDERDPQLSALYRASATEAPPRRLDEAILSAARSESTARPVRPWWRWFPASWALPVSVAAVVVLSVSVVLLYQAEEGVESLPRAAAPPESAVPASRDMAGKAARDTLAEAAHPRQGAPAIATDSTAGSAGPTVPPAAPREVDAIPGETRRSAERERLARESAPAERSETSKGVRAAEAVAQAPPVQAPSAPGMSESAVLEKAATANAGPAVKAESAHGTLDRDERTPMSPAPAVVAGSSRAGRDSDAAPSTAPLPAARPAAKAAAVPPPSAPPGAVSAQAPADDKQRAASAPAEAQRRSFDASRASPSREDAARDSDPEKWLARIEQLRREGRHAEAKASLEEFRRRHPNYPVPRHLE